MKLNKEQREAIGFGTGPLLIIAGAGTGKTTVITERIKHLIEKGFATPNQILALTFTEKAAAEMERRIDEVLPLGVNTVSVNTFHAFCDQVLRESGLHIGIDTKYKLLTQSESLNLLKTNLYALGLNYFAPLGNPTKFLFGLLDHFSRLQDENMSASEYLSWAKKKEKIFKKGSEEEKLESRKWLELAKAYETYERLKTEKSFFDFGDLITKTILLFQKRPNVLKEYQKRFSFILVDEFQDTNYSQNKLVLLMSGENGNITVVGDDDQSIYRFRGASVSNILQFKKHYPKAKVVTLSRNYRSKQDILDHAYALIVHNNPDRLEVIESINKKLIAEKGEGGVVEHSLHRDASSEADFVAEKIISLSEKGKYKFSDFAILVRANSHADSFVRAFDVNGIPYQFLGPGKLFQEPIIQDLVSYLTAISNPEDNSAFYKVLSSKIANIDSFDVARWMSRARSEKLPLYEIFQSIEHSDETKKLLSLVQGHVKKSRNESAATLAFEFLSEMQFKEKLINENSSIAIKEVQDIERLFSKIKNFETLNPQNTLFDLLDWISLQTELGESPQSEEIEMTDDKVNILTVHGSKGLEFPVVFLVNLVSQRFPSIERGEQIPIPDELIRETLPKENFHIEEERRLFYVGMTRTKEELYMTSANFYGEGKRAKKVSQFVSEVMQKTSSKIYKSNNLNKKISVSLDNKKNIKIRKLSYSSIETFRLCPLHFKLQYLLNVPTPPTPSQSMGISFHETMKDFYIEISQDKKPSKKLLQTLLSKNWRREGYISEKHVEKSFEKTKGFLNFFYENWFDKKNFPIALEEKISFKIKDLLITGVIDRVDKTTSGIHIIDYKTGANVMSQKDADKSLQLSIYALSFLGKYTPEQIKLSLMYFDSKEIVTTKRTLKQLNAAREEILDWRNKIEESDFECSGNFFCQNCEYNEYCHASQNKI